MHSLRRATPLSRSGTIALLAILILGKSRQSILELLILGFKKTIFPFKRLDVSSELVSFLSTALFLQAGVLQFLRKFLHLSFKLADFPMGLAQFVFGLLHSLIRLSLQSKNPQTAIRRSSSVIWI
mmetsp:Transcript_12835/g.22137  ORF Transcript_12835/g.22137 Transcript_12835/m.22137 type:complete len:125 (+) Transcript_12835:699-1073(+)